MLYLANALPEPAWAAAAARQDLPAGMAKLSTARGSRTVAAAAADVELPRCPLSAGPVPGPGSDPLSGSGGGRRGRGRRRLCGIMIAAGSHTVVVVVAVAAAAAAKAAAAAAGAAGVVPVGGPRFAAGPASRAWRRTLCAPGHPARSGGRRGGGRAVLPEQIVISHTFCFKSLIPDSCFVLSGTHQWYSY